MIITYISKFKRKLKFILESKKIENLEQKHFNIIHDLAYFKIS